MVVRGQLGLGNWGNTVSPIRTEDGGADWTVASRPSEALQQLGNPDAPTTCHEWNRGQKEKHFTAGDARGLSYRAGLERLGLRGRAATPGCWFGRNRQVESCTVGVQEVHREGYGGLIRLASSTRAWSGWRVPQGRQPKETWIRLFSVEKK